MVLRLQLPWESGGGRSLSLGDASVTLTLVGGSLRRRLRTQRQLSQERLGHESGSGRTRVSQLERGEPGPSLKTVVNVAVALDVTLSEVIRRVEAELKKRAQ